MRSRTPKTTRKTPANQQKRAVNQQKKAAEASKRGRPTRLTPNLEAEIIATVELGVPMRTAALKAGVPEGTFDSWQRQGRQGRQPYSHFCMGLTRARATAAVNLHIRALSGGPGSSAAMWLLERRYPDDYGSRQKLDVSDNQAAPSRDIAGALDAMPLDELREWLAKLQRSDAPRRVHSFDA